MESSLDTPGVQISYSCTPTQPCSASPSSIEVSTVLLAFEQVAVRPCRHILNHIYNQKKNRKRKPKEGGVLQQSLVASNQALLLREVSTDQSQHPTDMQKVAGQLTRFSYSQDFQGYQNRKTKGNNLLFFLL
ncbi:uncharacterized protein [Gossypium hirsutum]|uniref:Uncharacterized protein n=1 Tax=Gossypium hirsutum TaxID=3635 RepID=A0ABM2ZX23_GOSHI|nr:uncharacterized protein LOC121216051 [Gossypium hirsutum]